jgi:sugar phosphate isomerase/epimerase
MHRRVGLHQVAFGIQDTPEFVNHCTRIGVNHITVASPALETPSQKQALTAVLKIGTVGVESICHPFAMSPNLEHDERATERLRGAIETAVDLDAASVYLVTGGRGALSWEQAAERFAQLLAPCREQAAKCGIRLLVETASAFNADIHIAHTLADAIALAQIADIGVCIDLHACWFESGLRAKFSRAASITGLVQVSDYVLGDRTAPCRAVPGDGVIPLERVLVDLLEVGYAGIFDIELLGPRIATEGPATATTRAAEYLSDLLTKLGA